MNPTASGQTANGSPHERIESVIRNVEQVILGKRLCVEQALIALLCGGHLLLEDVPGVGKTMMIRALSASLGVSFRRIQFTPDLLPSDITGVSVFNQQSGEFEFRPGPIMAGIVLADEINRASPRTQSALLEAIEEKQVTADGKTYRLPNPFLVMATQNPREYQGTFALSEALTDRFMLRMEIGYLEAEQEVAMLDRLQERHPIESIEPVMTAGELRDLQRQVRQIYVEDSIKRYIVELVGATRSRPEFANGASPRATIALMKAAQARAWMSGRTYCLPDDVKSQFHAVVSHRLLPSRETGWDKGSMAGALGNLLQTVPVPVWKGAGNEPAAPRSPMDTETNVRRIRRWFQRR